MNKQFKMLDKRQENNMLLELLGNYFKVIVKTIGLKC